MRPATLSNCMKTQLDTGDGRSPSLLKVVPNNTSNPMPKRGLSSALRAPA